MLGVVVGEDSLLWRVSSQKPLYRSDRLSRLLRAFSYDRFKIYLIVPIVWIELNSIQAIEVVSDVWVV